MTGILRSVFAVLVALALTCPSMAGYSVQSGAFGNISRSGMSISDTLFDSIEGSQGFAVFQDYGEFVVESDMDVYAMEFSYVLGSDLLPLTRGDEPDVFRVFISYTDGALQSASVDIDSLMLGSSMSVFIEWDEPLFLDEGTEIFYSWERPRSGIMAEAFNGGQATSVDLYAPTPGTMACFGLSALCMLRRRK